jgi:hypothetical protein
MAVIVPASTRQKTVGIVMVAASLAYLTHFVGRLPFGTSVLAVAGLPHTG